MVDDVHERPEPAVVEKPRWQVPGDVSVVGYSDSPYAEYLGLTTVDVPMGDIGREATRVLLGAITDPAMAPQSIYPSTELFVRRTCGPPNGLRNVS